MKIPLKTLREKKKITQAEFSKQMNVAPSTIGLWEQGRREPNYDTLNKIADIFHVTTDYLLGRESESSNEMTREERNLLADYNNLTVEGKQTLLNVLGGLKMTHSLGRQLPG